MIDKKYLRGRPFLLVEFSQKPRDKVNTKVKGWMNDPNNLVTHEHVSVVDSIGPKQTSAKIIIDIIEGTAIRNLVGKPDDAVISHYIGRYAEMIKQSLHKWAALQIKKEMINPTVEES